MLVNRDIDEKVDECLSILSARYGREFDRPEIRYDLRGRVAGQRNGKSLRFNLDLLDDDATHSEMINQVVPHEVAHWVQRILYPDSQSHGYEWAEIMHVLGVPAKRTHSMAVKPARVHKRPYIYACNCREFNITPLLHRKMQNGQRRYCRNCRGYLHFVRENAAA
jgi:SprT protein